MVARPDVAAGAGEAQAAGPIPELSELVLREREAGAAWAAGPAGCCLICAAGGSGTTLAVDLLGFHSAVAPLYETEFVTEIAALIRARGFCSLEERGWASSLRPQKVLWIAGTWENFEPVEMTWDGSAWVHYMEVGTNCEESFQLLVDGTWDATLYPNVAHAHLFCLHHSLCGPDSENHGKDWVIGSHRLDIARKGDRFKIMVAVDAQGDAKRVSWRREGDLGPEEELVQDIRSIIQGWCKDCLDHNWDKDKGKHEKYYHGSVYWGRLKNEFISLLRRHATGFSYDLAMGCSPLQALSTFLSTIFAVHASKEGRSFVANKTPSYVDVLPVLARALPNAKVVHVVRDARDVANSVMPRNFGPNSVHDVVPWWEGRIQHARAFQAAKRDQYFELRYESFVTAPDKELPRLLAFLGLKDESAEILDFRDDSWYYGRDKKLFRLDPTRIRAGGQLKSSHRSYIEKHAQLLVQLGYKDPPEAADKPPAAPEAAGGSDPAAGPVTAGAAVVAPERVGGAAPGGTSGAPSVGGGKLAAAASAYARPGGAVAAGDKTRVEEARGQGIARGAATRPAVSKEQARPGQKDAAKVAGAAAGSAAGRDAGVKAGSRGGGAAAGREAAGAGKRPATEARPAFFWEATGAGAQGPRGQGPGAGGAGRGDASKAPSAKAAVRTGAGSEPRTAATGAAQTSRTALSGSVGSQEARPRTGGISISKAGNSTLRGGASSDATPAAHHGPNPDRVVGPLEEMALAVVDPPAARRPDAAAFFIVGSWSDWKPQEMVRQRCGRRFCFEALTVDAGEFQIVQGGSGGVDWSKVFYPPTRSAARGGRAWFGPDKLADGCNWCMGGALGSRWRVDLELPQEPSNSDTAHISWKRLRHEAEIVCYIEGGDGRRLAVDKNAPDLGDYDHVKCRWVMPPICMSKSAGKYETWRLLRQESGEFRIKSCRNLFLATWDKDEQGHFMASGSENPLRLNWTFKPSQQESGRWYITGPHGTNLARQMEDPEQAIYMSPNNQEWELWTVRLVDSP